MIVVVVVCLPCSLLEALLIELSNVYANANVIFIVHSVHLSTRKRNAAHIHAEALIQCSWQTCSCRERITHPACMRTLQIDTRIHAITIPFLNGLGNVVYSLI